MHYHALIFNKSYLSAKNESLVFRFTICITCSGFDIWEDKRGKINGIWSRFKFEYRYASSIFLYTSSWCERKKVSDRNLSILIAKPKLRYFNLEPNFKLCRCLARYLLWIKSATDDKRVWTANILPTRPWDLL